MVWPFRRRTLSRLAQQDVLPVAWATAPNASEYLNLGDALSPIMVSLVTGKPTRHVSTRSSQSRIAAVGTIGHSFSGGEIWFWGTGSSRYVNPGAPAKERIRFTRPADTVFNLCATRGPVSRMILSDGAEPAAAPTYGDPVWLLPRFYRPQIEKKWELGVIIHLADLEDRAFEAHPKPQHHRYTVSEDEKSSIRLINTVTDVSIEAMQERLDEILACKRIISTSLHGMVIAEAYGIPCLYFSPRNLNGLTTIPLDPDGDLDLRITDLYLGIGETTIPAYAQPRQRRTDWEDVLKAVDSSWTPKTFKGDELIAASPLEPKLLKAPPNGTVFDLPAIRNSQLRHGGILGKVGW